MEVPSLLRPAHLMESIAATAVLWLFDAVHRCCDFGYSMGHLCDFGSLMSPSLRRRQLGESSLRRLGHFD
jgi:hypothetical protein